MREVAFILMGLAILGSVTEACAASALPPAVEAQVESDVKDCATHDVKFEKGFMTRKDINGDGREDYILDYGHYVCGGMHSTFCGSAGCTIVVFASRGGEYVKVLNENVRGLEFKTIGGRPAMLLGLHGSACGKAGSAQCGATLFWNGEKFSPAH